MSYMELINLINNCIYNNPVNTQRMATINIPIWIWWSLATLVENIPSLQHIIALERAQVELMKDDLTINMNNNDLQDFEYKDCLEIIRNASK
eukprot:TRINITY_DN1267_c0_g1_i2.p1 TRINITY_DN1267_c0_g1~~TRINITY_DN1267_c0_g1_i2.p1  ORF type:complete len:103 (+),score=7.66 TRINITY_DN1267_c0_g1_i2:35-310(+)